MKAWRVNEITEDGIMTFEDVPEPEPDEKGIVVRVEAAGLNFLDTLVIKGKYQEKPEPPFTPGMEVAGTVVKAGAGSKFKPGDRVCSSCRFGGYAEMAKAKDEQAVKMPDGMPATDGLAMITVYPTSHLGLKHKGGIKAGDTVLVHAGAGGVGSAAIELAKAWGAGKIIATAGGPDKVQVCRDMGADLAIDYKEGDWVQAVKDATDGQGCDLIYDPVGDAVGENSLRVLAWGGRYLVVGFAGGEIPRLKANIIMLKNAAAVGVYWGATKAREPAVGEAVVDDCMALYEAGKLHPLIRDKFPLAEAPAAMAALAGRSSVGKVVLEVA